MSRTARALRSLHPPFTVKGIWTHIPKSTTKPSVKQTCDVPRTHLFSFLSSVRTSRSEFLARLCSSSSTTSSGSGQKKSDVKSVDDHNILGGQKNADNAAESMQASQEEDTKKIHSDQVNQVNEDGTRKKSPTANTNNVASDPSPAVEEDIKKQVKRLSEMLEGVSTDAKRKEASGFSGSLFPPGSSSLLTFDWLAEPLRIVESACNWFYGRMIQNVMDFKFDVDEFLEGAKDAFYMVNRLFEEGDYETLKPMISTKLCENMRITTEQFQKEGLQFTMTPENIVSAYVTGFKVVRAKSLIPFGPEFDIPELTEDKQNFWVLIYVRFSRSEHYKLFRSTGEVMQDSVSRRRDSWTFVRGPINELPLKEESSGWTVLSIA